MTHIEKSTIPVEAIDDIVQNKLTPALEGEDGETAVIAMLVMILLLVRPDLEMDEIQEHLLGLSGYLATILVEEEGGTVN